MKRELGSCDICEANGGECIHTNQPTSQPKQGESVRERTIEKYRKHLSYMQLTMTPQSKTEIRADELEILLDAALAARPQEQPKQGESLEQAVREVIECYKQDGTGRPPTYGRPNTQRAWDKVHAAFSARPQEQASQPPEAQDDAANECAGDQDCQHSCTLAFRDGYQRGQQAMAEKAANLCERLASDLGDETKQAEAMRKLAELICYVAGAVEPPQEKP